ncbi:MAG TPA: hypothetical protein VGI40_22175 [Pirellulaceae bacterium]
MPQPLRGNVSRILVGKLSGPRGAKVLKQLGPRRQASIFDNAIQLGPQIGVRLPVARDNKLRTIGGGVPCGFEVRPQFCEDGHQPRILAVVVFSLGAADSYLGRCPIHVRPPQRQKLAGNPQATVAGESKDKLPFSIRARFKHLGGVGTLHEVVAGLVFLYRAILHLLERVFADQFITDGGLEKLLCPAAAAPNCVDSQISTFEVFAIRPGQSLAIQADADFRLTQRQPSPEPTGVAGRDCRHVAIFAEVSDQTVAHLGEIDLGARLHGLTTDVGVQVHSQFGCARRRVGRAD